MKYLAIVGVAIVGLSGCAFRPQSESMAIEYNEFVATATNRQTALNILRASVREPLHFTSISKILGTVHIDGSAELNLFNDGISKTRDLVNSGTSRSGSKTINGVGLSSAIGVSISSGTDFEIAVDTNDEFWKGILGPISPDTLVYYLRQGWPADMISHMFIGRIDFTATIKNIKGDTRKIKLMSVANSPDDPELALDFSKIMKCRKLSYSLVQTKSLAIGSSSLSDLTSPSLANLRNIQNTDSNSADSGKYILNLPAENKFGISLSKSEEEDDCREYEALIIEKFNLTSKEFPPGTLRQDKGIESTPSVTSQESANITGRANVTVIDANADKDYRAPQLGAGGASFDSIGFFNNRLSDEFTGDLSIDVSLRSIEGVIYYLGQYIRNPEVSPKLKGLSCGEGSPYCIPIILVIPSDNATVRDSFIELDFKGRRYSIPSSGKTIVPNAGQSSQAINLIQQILNLHRSSKDLPSTGLVRVLN